MTILIVMNLGFAWGDTGQSTYSPLAFRPSAAPRVNTQTGAGARVQGVPTGAPRVKFQVDGRPANS